LPLVSKGSGSTATNEKLCQLCQQYSTEALFYLQQNETQTEILSVLNHACANLGPLRQQVWTQISMPAFDSRILISVNWLACIFLQCITLVDYYIPILLLEVSVVKPEQFCESAHLCPKGAAIPVSAGGEACGLCHQAVVEVLTMLKDPNAKVNLFTAVIDLHCSGLLVLCAWLMPFRVCVCVVIIAAGDS
jgi:saposin